MLLAANISRAASGLIPFGLVAFYTSRSQFMEAGIVSTVSMLAGAVTAPYKARLLTRMSPARLLLPLAVAGGALIIAAQTVALGGALFGVSALLLAMGFAVLPPTPAVIRELWTQLTPSEAASRTLHALDSVLEELTFALTPLLTSLIWALSDPYWAIVLGVVLAVVGNALIIAVGSRQGTATRHLLRTPIAAEPNSALAGDTRAERHRFKLRLAPDVIPNALSLLLPIACLGLAMSALTIVLPAWSQRVTGSQPLSGVLLSLISWSGTLAGFIFGRMRLKASDSRQYQFESLLLLAAVGLFAVSTFLPAILALLLAFCAALLFGAAMTPLFVSSYVLVGPAFAGSLQSSMNAALGSTYNLADGLASLAFAALLQAKGAGWTLVVLTILVALGVCFELLRPVRAAGKPAAESVIS
ncbi:MFS transporter [Bombiscardovia apis]|uniref:MFS transporter n=1 Tax=Bombiscardovia apis TaxID=2932182 RepID=UPI002955D18F|nr:MFS transporter [Bombiscardovia apis]